MTTKPPFRWHLARTPSRTYCNQILRTKVAHFNAHFFLQEPVAQQCTACARAYHDLTDPLHHDD